MGAETVLPFRSLNWNWGGSGVESGSPAFFLKTLCGLKVRLSVRAAAWADTATQPQRIVDRIVVFRTGAPPIHSMKGLRKPFLVIFSIKKVTSSLPGGDWGLRTLLGKACRTEPIPVKAGLEPLGST